MRTALLHMRCLILTDCCAATGRGWLRTCAGELHKGLPIQHFDLGLALGDRAHAAEHADVALQLLPSPCAAAPS